jgi:RHH-type transcriptional regulator, proline utilization regulon repressor / proline dehydrogenase / delta 1-pyrroline-5-carboxylate dehydrogenase
VRESVDFLRYYADQAAREFSEPQILPGPAGEANTLSLQGRGVFVCISPWNFPLAIFVGQLAAALAAGNAVLAKPAPQTPIIAHEAVRILHEAGIPNDALMLVIGDAEIGAALVEHRLVAGVAFTGSTATAKRINAVLAGKPGAIVPLIAETGGQNVMFVDSTALLEQVTDDVIKSSFHSAGQRCSALRVLYLQADIADAAIAMIKGAMALLKTGDPREIDTDVGPVIDEAAAKALRLHIEDMETQGRAIYAGPASLAETSGLFVVPTLFEISSMTELDKENFGPVLHVIRYQADKLDEALADAFSSGFGLTLGIHTRMDRRWQQIAKDAPVGNIYVNRNMVGAVVGSQPFGGQGLSGTGFKAGGPRYLYRFATEKTLSVNTAASGGNVELLALG